MTRALILAAGQGTRLRPLTNDKPKCLVDFLGKSLLERQIHTLEKAGITNINIATGFCADQIETFGYNTSYNPRFDKTNMVETFFSAIDFILEGNCDLIIAYGDIIYQLDNLNALLTSKDEIALMIDAKWRDLWSLRLENPLEDAETLVLDEKGFVTELGKKPLNYDRIHGQYTGLIKIRADKIDELVGFYEGLDRQAQYDGKSFDNMYMTSFLQLLINHSWKAKAVLVNNGWLEFDSLDDLKHYETLANQGLLSRFYRLEQ